MAENIDSSKSLTLVNKLMDYAIEGFGPLDSAYKIADEYLNDRSYKNNEERVNSLIRWEISKNFTSGFVTGLGGILTLPVTVPAALGASWAIQARMVGAIALIHGHDLREDRVRTLALISLVGDSAKEILKDISVKVGKQVTVNAIKQIPGKVLIEINKKVGFRLLTKAGEKGIINLTKVVPIVGGIISGTIDAYACNVVGDTAHDIFNVKDNQTIYF